MGVRYAISPLINVYTHPNEIWTNTNFVPLHLGAKIRAMFKQLKKNISGSFPIAKSGKFSHLKYFPRQYWKNHPAAANWPNHVSTAGRCFTKHRKKTPEMRYFIYISDDNALSMAEVTARITY